MFGPAQLWQTRRELNLTLRLKWFSVAPISDLSSPNSLMLDAIHRVLNSSQLSCHIEEVLLARIYAVKLIIRHLDFGLERLRTTLEDTSILRICHDGMAIVKKHDCRSRSLRSVQHLLRGSNLRGAQAALGPGE